jgi:hypothetical protein
LGTRYLTSSRDVTFFQSHFFFTPLKMSILATFVRHILSEAEAVEGSHGTIFFFLGHTTSQSYMQDVMDCVFQEGKVSWIVTRRRPVLMPIADLPNIKNEGRVLVPRLDATYQTTAESRTDILTALSLLCTNLERCCGASNLQVRVKRCHAVEHDVRTYHGHATGFLTEDEWMWRQSLRHAWLTSTVTLSDQRWTKGAKRPKQIVEDL